MIDWSEVLGELITQGMKILLPVCIALILKWAGELWLKLKEAKPDVAKVLSYAVTLAVQAAEQIFGDGHGVEKKTYAIQFVNNLLAEQGLKVNGDVIADAIESAVWEEINCWKRIQERNDTAE